MAYVIKNDLTIVKIYWEGNSYQVLCESVKDTDKQDIEKIYATESHEPSQIVFGQVEYSIDLSGCQSHRWLFEWIRERQKSGIFWGYPGLTTYKYQPNTGKVIADKVYTKVFVEEISGENQDNFDVKLVPMKRNYRDAKNKFYG